ncbi:MAG: hypothetical protein K1X51_14425 [Rhodospirillaceae bacterium]|nr:hypothetical protein [Rhodospirillaceae bacterium]
MRVVFGLVGLAIVNAASAAEAPAPGVLIKCTGTEERQVRDLVADANGRLKKGDFTPPETKPETFEHVFKVNVFRITTRDGRSTTSTETCEVKGDTFTCVTQRGQSPVPYVMEFNLATGAYSAASDDELVKSRRKGSCDMTQARALLEQAKNNPVK